MNTMIDHDVFISFRPEICIPIPQACDEKHRADRRIPRPSESVIAPGGCVAFTLAPSDIVRINLGARA
jgi:hypothetical protein